MSLELKNIKKVFRETIVFDNLNFDFSLCGMYLLSGKSGSGKTTLLNILAGYEPIDNGRRNVDESIEIACIFQSYELIEELTVKENIMMVNDVFKRNDMKNQYIIDKLGLSALLNHYPSELSQGQKQRVGIARALWSRPKVIICDEPTESLDVENKEEVLSLLKDISKDNVVIIASHDNHSIGKYYDYHYHIENKKIILLDKMVEGKGLENIVIDETIDTKELNQYIKKIIHKKTFIQTTMMCLLIIFQILLFQVDIKLFTKPTTMNALNANSIYVKSHGTPKEIIKKYSKTMNPVLTFSPLEINGRSIKVDIYPKRENKNILNAKEIKDKEILINQNMFAVLEESQKVDEDTVIGKKISLSYELANAIYVEQFTIAGVVEEKDVNSSMQIYYSYEGMNNILKSKIGVDRWETQYDYLQEQADNYELVCSSDTVDGVFESVSKDSKLSVYNSVLTARNQDEQQSSLYQILFIIMQVLALLLTIGYIFYYVSKDCMKNSFNLSIIHAVGVPLDKVKNSFFKEKIKYLLLLVIIIPIPLLITPFYLHISLWQYIIIMGYFIGCIALYVVLLKIKLYHFNKESISLILKEDKDN